MTLFGIRVFANIIKNLKTRLFWVSLAPESNDILYVLIRHRRHRDMQRGGHVKTAAEIGAM